MMNNDTAPFFRALPPGTILPHNYIIDTVLGEGGFGITYSASLQYTEERFAIKEYFPGNIAYRATTGQGASIVHYSGQQELFEKGRRHFLTEASVLRELRHLEHIVKVKDILEANGTIYLVMEFIDGITLKQYITENGAIPFDELFPLITPVMRDLIQVHKKGLLHRDISPDNLMLGTDNKLHLIDFGAADFKTAPDQQEMTVLLKSGFAPLEQYLSDGKLGAWTDIYGLCATLYYALTGFAPTESIRRLQSDNIPALADHAQIRSWQAAAIEKGIRLHAADRYPNMEELYQSLIIPPIAVSSKRASMEQSIKNDKTVIPFYAGGMTGREKSEPIRKRKWQSLSPKYAIGAIGVIGILLYTVLRTGGITQDSKQAYRDNLPASEEAQNPNRSSTADTAELSIYKMPDLTGHSLTDAQHALQLLDPSIRIQTSYVLDPSLDGNTVISQSIASGTSFTRGSLDRILLTISLKEETTTEAATVMQTEQPATRKAATNETQKTTQAAKQDGNHKNTTTEEEDDFDFIQSENDINIISD